MMIGESLAIVAVIVVFAAMIAKSGRGVFAAFVAPLVSIPVLHLLAYILGMRSRMLLFQVIGLALGLLLCLAFSRALRLKRSRYRYLVFCCFFLIALFVAYRINLA